jgi:hypothetical protein
LVLHIREGIGGGWGGGGKGEHTYDYKTISSSKADFTLFIKANLFGFLLTSIPLPLIPDFRKRKIRRSFDSGQFVSRHIILALVTDLSASKSLRSTPYKQQVR